MNAQFASSCLGLALTIYDMQLLRKDEKTLIWTTPIHLTTVKLLYLLSRYLALVLQLCNVALSAFLKYSYTAIPSHTCEIYFVFKITASHIMLGLLHTILVLRGDVYALYNKSLKILSTLMLVYILRLSVTIWTMTHLSRIDGIEFDAICISAKSVDSEPGIAVFVIGEILNQFVIHTLTMRKTWALKGAWDKTPTLPSVLTRDGFYVFIAIFGSMIAVIAASYEKGTGSLFIFPLFILMTSCAGCRVILRLQSLGTPELAETNQDIILTTVDSVWDTRSFLITAGI